MCVIYKLPKMKIVKEMSQKIKLDSTNKHVNF